MGSPDPPLVNVMRAALGGEQRGVLQQSGATDAAFLQTAVRLVYVWVGLTTLTYQGCVLRCSRRRLAAVVRALTNLP